MVQIESGNVFDKAVNRCYVHKYSQVDFLSFPRLAGGKGKGDAYGDVMITPTHEEMILCKFDSVWGKL